MVIKYTEHIHDKLKLKEIIELKINLETIANVLNNPVIIDKSIEPHQSISKISKQLRRWKVV